MSKRITLERRVPETAYVDGKRLNKTPVGLLPGPTTVISSTSGKDWSEWRANNPEEAKRVLQRGTDLHKAIENFFNTGELSDQPLFQLAYTEVLQHIDLVVAEHLVYSSRGYGGTLDCLAYWDDQLTIIDWKGATKPKSSDAVYDYLLQVSAYHQALAECDGIAADRCVIVVLPEGRKKAQFFELPPSGIEMRFNDFCCRLRQFQDQEWEDL